MNQYQRPELSDIFSEMAKSPSYRGKKPKSLHDRGIDDNTPLHVAVLCGDLNAGRALLEAGANPNAPGEHSDTPLQVAIKKGNCDFVQLLLSHDASKDLKNEAGLSASDLVAQAKDPQLKTIFSSWPKHKFAQDVETILKEIEKGEYPDLLEIKLSGVNARGVLGDTPLHLISSWGDTTKAKILLDADANPNLPGEYDNTPLHEAVRGKKYEMVKLLLEYGASKDLRNEDGFTAADYAEKSGDTRLKQLLAQKGNTA
ncbi:MAG TPA: ankyrin repeat domain-containing protein [Verrucomicrobiae bacterium]|jgi:ankyrin repeat protein|nr:ankyrin repeat domain-containing protein [Verrucomicrobiae bacterium]